MPRGRIGGRARRIEMQALRYEQLCRDTRVKRRDHYAREAALALRKATPDWVDLDRQLKQLELEAEMDAMEACIDERRPEIPILDKALVAKLRAAYPGLAPDAAPTTAEPEPHPDVKIAADLRAAEARRSANENHKPPPGEKAWKYESKLEGYPPKDDWRNYED